MSGGTEEKGLGLERMVFFSDAVVAIAITLLALELKLEPAGSGHLTFTDILGPWKTFLAFVLSFMNIASFWKTHHMFFNHIRKIDERLMWFNILWLFFIVTLPFCTKLVSSYFFDTPSIFIYSFNVFLISIFQNLNYLESERISLLQIARAPMPKAEHPKQPFNKLRVQKALR